MDLHSIQPRQIYFKDGEKEKSCIAFVRASCSSSNIFGLAYIPYYIYIYIYICICICIKNPFYPCLSHRAVGFFCILLQNIKRDVFAYIDIVSSPFLERRNTITFFGHPSRAPVNLIWDSSILSAFEISLINRFSNWTGFFLYSSNGTPRVNSTCSQVFGGGGAGGGGEWISFLGSVQVCIVYVYVGLLILNEVLVSILTGNVIPSTISL